MPLLLDVAFGALLARRLRGAASEDVVDELADLIMSGTAPRMAPGLIDEGSPRTSEPERG